MDKQKDQLQQTQRITIIGVIVNSLLAIFKITFGFVGNSQALLADGIHSFSDLLTDALVLIAVYFSSQHADREHPYGHARIETVATIILALILFLAGVGIVYDAIHHLLYDKLSAPNSYVLWIALVSVVANEWLFRATMNTARNVNSDLLKANAWHHRSDAASSVVVLLGVFAALYGYTYLDSIAAVIVALMIGRMSFTLAWQGFRELIDTAVDEQTLQAIEKCIVNVPGVHAAHQLRTRSMAGAIFIDVHVLVASELTVSEGHHISQKVHQALLHDIEEVSDVTVHIDPEDDEVVAPSLHLPTRDIVESELVKIWQDIPGGDVIKTIQLHYLDGKIHIDVYLPFELAKSFPDITALQHQYQQAVADKDYIGKVTCYFGVDQ